MEPNNINQTPVTPTPTPIPPAPEPIIPPIQQGVSSFNQPKEPKPIGPMIGAFIIIALLIAAAVYFWGQKLNNDDAMPEAQQTSNVQIEDTPARVNDDYSQIEDSLDSTLQDIEEYNF